MIVKVLDPAGIHFPGVEYNDKKVDKGKGELMLMKNFPSFINENSTKEEVRNYLASISFQSTKIEKPQFHAMISTKFQEHSKEELTKIAENFMDEMKYGEQPFIVVFHNDTENRHVHIVSTRVDKSSGKKINDSYEKLKAQKALALVMEKLYGLNAEERIEKLLAYKYGTLKQMELLMLRGGYRLSQNKNNNNAFDILKNGVSVKTISGNHLILTTAQNNQRAKQLKAILSKYKDLSSNKVFKVEDRREQEAMLPEDKQNEDWKPKIEFESELQKKLRDMFGIDIVFHHKDGKTPFGYTLIDHKTGTVYKGSEIMKMNELFEFTSEMIDKRLFESLKDYNISDDISKQVLQKHLKVKDLENAPSDFMLFETRKRKNKEIFNSVKNDLRQYLKTQNNPEVKLIRSDEGKYYAVHERLHYVGELKYLIGEKEYLNFLYPTKDQESEFANKNEDFSKEMTKSINDMIFEFRKSSGGTGKDPAEEENKKRRKRKKR
ncbi:relaxase/mobilization nuclease domain-containing protein [Epilithonimonas caeni]|uniref:relaxase/mobilization nuclease domain-containing protein n=1 Tax=Epilithonimonas caeni TaxID=365343 RepID=UPI0003FA385A|nr:relaxase/mobilization nuclease domain-containing protein [Epilithonimonas caeni]